jgi:hypothetical protein
MNILINESEKERILGMHRKAIKKEFLFEYETPQPTSPIPIVSPKTPEPPVMANSDDANLRADLEIRLKETEAIVKALKSGLDEMDAAKQIEKTKNEAQLVNNTIAEYELKIDKKCQNLRRFGDFGQKRSCRDWRGYLDLANRKKLELMGIGSEKESGVELDPSERKLKNAAKVALGLDILESIVQMIVQLKIAFPKEEDKPPMF